MSPGRSRWLWLIAFVGFTALAFAAVRFKRDTLVDFEVYRTAGTRAVAAEPLYRPEDGHYQFKYLPAFAVAMVPVALLPHEVATIAWFTLTAALLVAFLREAVRLLPNRRLSERTAITLAVLFLGKCYVKELLFGQTNLLFGVVLFAALRAVTTGRPEASGALIAAAVFIKPYAIILLPWVLIARGVRSAIAAAGVMLAGLAVPALLYGWAGNIGQLESWLRTVTQTTGPNLLHPENISLAGLWARWIGQTEPAAMLATGSALALLGLVAAVVAARRRVAEPAYLEFGLLLIVVPLISPQGWDYVLLLGTPVLLCVIDRWPAIPAGWRVAAALAIGVIGFTIFDLVGRAAYMWLMAVSATTVAALVLIGVAAGLRWRRLA